MQKLILLFSSKCTLFLLVVLPFGIVAQSTTQATTAQQQAEALFVQQNPQVQKVDLEKLQAEQKDQHKKCNTCGKKSTATTNLGNPSIEILNLDQLKKEESRLTSIIQGMVDNGSTDKSLFDKYKRALMLNQQRVRVAESQQIVENKKQLAPSK